MRRPTFDSAIKFKIDAGLKSALDEAARRANTTTAEFVRRELRGIAASRAAVHPPAPDQAAA